MSLFKIKLLLLLFLVINASLAAAGINGSAALDLGLSWYQFRGPSNSLYEEEKLFSLPGADFDISIPLGKKIYLNFSELFANNLNSELNNEITAEYLQELKPNSSLAVLFSHTYEKTASSTNETNTYQDEAPCNDLLAEININLNHSENYSLYAGLQHEYKKYTRIKSNSSLEDILNPGFDLNFIRSFNKYNLLTTELQADMQFKKGYSNNAFVKDTLDAELAVEYEHNFILGGSVAAAAGVKQYYSFIYNYDRYLTFTLENKLEKDFAFDHQLGYDLTLERKQTTFSYLNNPENDSTWALIFYPEVKFNFGKYFFLDITPAVEAEKYDAATNRDYNYYQLTGEAGLGFKASRKFRIEVVPGVSRQTYYDFFISNNITTNQVITEISNTAFGSITNTYTTAPPPCRVMPLPFP
ncbi:MAG TPA: hypothetical protein VKS21_09150 [Spirochaetota bacterium]|nr:hypothetical protein [Spirochaetota bacterium]